MRTLYFDNEALPVRDIEAREKAKLLNFTDIYTSNDLVVTEARVLFLQGEIPKFRIMFQGKEIEMDNRARIPHWPVGFGDRIDKLLEILFDL